MRASELLKVFDFYVVEMDRQGIKLSRHYHQTRDLSRCLSRLESAVEALAADAGTGPARRIKAILDGEEGT